LFRLVGLKGSSAAATTASSSGTTLWLRLRLVFGLFRIGRLLLCLLRVGLHRGLQCCGLALAGHLGLNGGHWLFPQLGDQFDAVADDGGPVIRVAIARKNLGSHLSSLCRCRDKATLDEWVLRDATNLRGSVGRESAVSVAVQRRFLLVLKVIVRLWESSHRMAGLFLARGQELALGVFGDGHPLVAMGTQVELVEGQVLVLPHLQGETSCLSGSVQLFI
jgi:hypothetical protein